MSPHERPSDAQRCHWYVYEVGLFAHVPSFAVSVEPTFGVPVIVGGAVFAGAAALATPTKTPAATSTTAACRPNLAFMGNPPLPR
jgi:hypothetical protein